MNVKKEPGACQVAEISTSVSPIVKLEVTSPTQKSDGGFVNSPIFSATGKFLDFTQLYYAYFDKIKKSEKILM